MWLSALAAMILKYAEIVLAMSHRRANENGYSGGAMYYIKDLFTAKKFSFIGSVIAGIFAVLCIIDSLTMGCIIQVNAITTAFEQTLHLPSYAIGIILAIITFFIISGGKKGIVSVTNRLVPIMTIGYVVLSIAVLYIRKDALPAAFYRIFNEAFNFQSATGGILGFLTSRAIRYGTMRGLLSNEAGCGTAPIAHASSNSKNPVEQGFLGIFEVFTDTIILCTMTALVIIVNYDEAILFGKDSIMMTVKAYSSVLGQGAEMFFCIAILCFGYATVVCWAYYGIEALNYISKKKLYTTTYIVIYSFCVFLGSKITTDFAWGSADFAIGLMTIINIIIICLMKREVKSLTFSYYLNSKKSDS
jgi:AGCS family alanine or glycine:cation symporter